MQNPLIHRLSRHASLAILNHPAPAASPAPSGSRTPAAIGYLWPAEPAEPAGPEGNLHPARPPADPIASMPSAARQTGTQPAGNPPAIRQSGQPPAQAITAAKNPASATAQPEKSGTSLIGKTTSENASEPMDDTTWKRLENIFHRHQKDDTGSSGWEQAASSAMAPENREQKAPSIASTPEETAGLPNETRDRIGDEPEKSTPTIQRKQDPVVPLMHELPHPVILPATDLEQDAAKTGGGSPQAASQPPASPAFWPTGSAQNPGNPATPAADDLLPGWEAEAQEETTPDIEESSEDGPGAVHQHVPAVHQQVPAVHQHVPAVHQHVPLEAAWPVKTNPPPEPASPASTLPGAPKTGPENPLAVVSGRAEAGMKSQVSPTPDVGTHLPRTVSSVEVVPPSRPRPAGSLIQRSTEGSDSGKNPVSPASFENVSEPPAAAVQMGDRPDPRPAREPSSNPATSSAAPPSAGPVSTEIGALPGDLWTLIGENPPAQPGQAASGSGDPEPGNPVGDRAEVRSQSAVFAEPFMTAIQRQAEEPSSAVANATANTGASTGSSSVSGAEASAGQAAVQPPRPAPMGEAEIEQLARNVYTVLRRRLMDEWERVRRNF